MAANCEKVISDLFAAWTRLNVEEVMSHFAEDAVWDNVPMSPAKGKQAIREMTHGFMKDMSAFSVKILKSLHEGNVVFDSRVDTITTKSGKKAEELLYRRGYRQLAEGDVRVMLPSEKLSYLRHNPCLKDFLHELTCETAVDTKAKGHL
jgi:limonene-1,2-epoxide hydrolase